MLLVADSAFSFRIFDYFKIMLNANFIGTLANELKRLCVTVPANPVKVIRTNSNVIMYAICINVSADN